MGRRKRRKEAKAANAVAEATAKPKKKRRRLRKLLVFGSVAGGLAAWRQRQLADNEQKFGPR